MNFFEEYYSDKLPPRLTKLREKHKLTQTDVGNASQISQIEKGKRPITNSILYDFKDRTGLSYTDIIFGNLKDFVEDLFYHCFSTILFKDFSMPISNEVYHLLSPCRRRTLCLRYSLFIKSQYGICLPPSS